tara:strand:- start:348 stop:503 length:156 start_codon:yes stop_codon:yes gene_type:complete
MPGSQTRYFIIGAGYKVIKDKERKDRTSVAKSELLRTRDISYETTIVKESI